jgi:hypothetical protein
VCEDEFKVARHAVEWVLMQHGTLERLRTARDRRTNGMVKVSYETPTTPNGAWLAAVLAKDGLIDRMAADLDAAFILPEKVEIMVVNCTDPDAYFHTESRIVVLCWPLLEDFLERGKRRAAAGPQSLCAAPVAARLRPKPAWVPNVGRRPILRVNANFQSLSQGDRQPESYSRQTGDKHPGRAAAPWTVQPGPRGDLLPRAVNSKRAAMIVSAEHG